LAFLLATIMFCVAGGASKKDRTPSTKKSTGSRFGRRRTPKTKAVIINDVENGGVKSEYS